MGTVDKDTPEFMEAVTNYAPRDFRFSEQEKVPAKPDGGVLVKVTRCGICASDVKCYQGAPKFWGDAENEKFVMEPVIPGHEFVGEVVDIDEKDAERFGIKIGDQVTSEQLVPCHKCLYCKKNKRWLCEKHDIYGFHQEVPGAFAQYMTFPAHSLIYNIAKHVEPTYAAYVEPLSCGVHGVERAQVEAGDFVVVSGSGAIGLAMISTLKYDNLAKTIVALDCSDNRLEIARKCGADIVMNPTKQDVVKEVKGMCGGYGCDVYLEASGAPASVTQGILMTRKAGTFVEFSVFKEKTTVDWSVIGDTKELNIYGGHCSGDTGYKKAITMLEKNALPIEEIVTHDVPLRDFANGMGMVTAGSHGDANSIKVVLDPWSH
mmetsp:Transcript_174/g.551  ORF Transcript_174/g.551 Transcript_174/m.551 type:complete len:375 (+) Transcript_174:78-1202(+)|eukprot:CAMPEP_0198723614 /NCGR_PEP_ID=MMETSP1475-20131203/1133_1 /TAXON_ID= ORGANISM="Unidentified sp., Strain CCMP1999" /NCGR_SAMPLE_ID=MMETSP1475 /ASSEMBLY_ACC=CAM_ASM_001111 /LENGTH=374 /DNA_ID=CAMNT_0044484831 /DNA_START=61 /DNA_END=1185 /DNA_ORIENTATION=-